MAQQVRREVVRRLRDPRIRSIHLFLAVPQSLAMMIGRHSNGMPCIQTYEHCERTYYASFRLPASRGQLPMTHSLLTSDAP